VVTVQVTGRGGYNLTGEVSHRALQQQCLFIESEVHLTNIPDAHSEVEVSFELGQDDSVMPSAPSRTALRLRYDRRQDALVLKAARIFARQGYDQTTMQELAGSMDLATGALYHYFAGKEQLLAAICDQLMEPLLAQARDLVSVQAAEPSERLRAFVALWVTHVCDHRDHMLVFQQERHVIESGDRWRSVRGARKAFERLAAEILAAAVPGEDDGLALLALLGMVNHTAQWYRPRGRLNPQQIADGYVDLLLDISPANAES
jgi:AcrR family transcriptional regulator